MNRIDPLLYLVVVSAFLLLSYVVERIARRGRQTRAIPGESVRIVTSPLRRERLPIEAALESVTPTARIEYGRPPVIARRANRPSVHARVLLSDPRNLRRAIVAMAVLGPPRGQQRSRARAARHYPTRRHD